MSHVWIVIAAVAAAALLGADGSHAYELRTHALMTMHAFDRSPGMAHYLRDLDILRERVFDAGSVTAPTQLARFVNTGTARDWMAEGSIREDDYKRHAVYERLFACKPPANPPTEIDRVLHHFFDIQRLGGGLSLTATFPAPSWALGDQGRGPLPTQNQFALPDARVYQRQSLIEPSRASRDQATARMFRALGHVIHILQDMAQPQHTRDDAHAGCDSAVGRILGGETSWYEAYVETRVFSERFRTRALFGRPLPLQGYAPVMFSAFRDYWGHPGVAGTGLADISSRNFFSAGTNLGIPITGGPCGGLEQPACFPLSHQRLHQRMTISLMDGSVVTPDVWFLVRPFVDPRTGAVTENVKVSTLSLWDQHLEQRGLAPKFTLNTFNYDDMVNILLPRAVGYSAGFLDRFFRGRIDAEFSSQPGEPAQLVLRPVNRSEEPLAEGTFTLYVDAPDGTRSAVPGGLLSVSGILPGAPAPGSLVVPAGVDVAALTLVYQGTLGDEPDVTLGKVWRGRPGVEVLFIEQNSLDIYFRNAHVVAPLDVKQHLNVDGSGLPGVPNFPDFNSQQRVIWGADGQSFAVRFNAGSFAAPRPAWAVFALTPRPPGATYTTAPAASLLRIVDGTPLSGPTGQPDDQHAYFLDRNRRLLYSGNREVRNDTRQILDGVLVDLQDRATLRQVPAPLLGEFGGQIDHYVIYADTLRPADDVEFAASYAYLDRTTHGPNAGTPMEVAVHRGGVRRPILPAYAPGTTRRADVITHPFSASTADPVRPQSNRRHIMFAVRDDSTTVFDFVYTVYVYSVDDGTLHVAGRDQRSDGTAGAVLRAATDPYLLFAGAAAREADVLYQAGEWDLIQSPRGRFANGADPGDVPLPESVALRFVDAWAPGGTSALDLRAPFPPVVSGLNDRAALQPLDDRFVLTIAGSGGMTAASSSMDVFFVGSD